MITLKSEAMHDLQYIIFHNTFCIYKFNVHVPGFSHRRHILLLPIIYSCILLRVSADGGIRTHSVSNVWNFKFHASHQFRHIRRQLNIFNSYYIYIIYKILIKIKLCSANPISFSGFSIKKIFKLSCF